MMKIVHYITRYLKTTKDKLDNSENKIFGIDAYIERLKPKSIDSISLNDKKKEYYNINFLFKF